MLPSLASVTTRLRPRDTATIDTYDEDKQEIDNHDRNVRRIKYENNDWSNANNQKSIAALKRHIDRKPAQVLTDYSLFHPMLRLADRGSTGRPCPE